MKLVVKRETANSAKGRISVRLEQKIKLIILRTLGTFSFIRIIEWKQIIKSLQIQKGEKIVDVACGVGGLTLKIAKKIVMFME